MLQETKILMEEVEKRMNEAREHALYYTKSREEAMAAGKKFQEAKANYERIKDEYARLCDERRATWS